MLIKTKIKGKEIEIEIPVSEYWIKRTEQRISPYWKNTDNLEKRMGKEFQNAFNALEKEMYTFAGKFGTDGKLTYSQARVIALMKEIKPHIDSLYEFHQTTLTEHLIACYKDNYFKGMYDLMVGTQVAFNFVGINNAAVKTAISFPFQGVNFSDQIWQDKNYLLFNLKKTVTDGIIRGDSTQSMVKEFMYREKKSKGEWVDKGALGKAKFNAERLLRTETANVLSASDKRMYDDYGLEEYEYVATLDNRTSSICRELDGSVFKVSDYTPGLNAPPMHPNCRSTTAPYFGDEIGKRIAKNLENGKYEYIPSDTTYKEWYSEFVE